MPEKDPREAETALISDTAGTPGKGLSEVFITNKLAIDDVMELICKVAIAEILGRESYTELEEGSVLTKEITDYFVKRP